MSESPQFSRRQVLLGAAVLLPVLGYGIYSYAYPMPPASVSSLDVATAHRLAMADEILLIDIRRPDEWRLTGIGEGAQPLDMRRPDFIEALEALAVNQRTLSIALICARGVRSARMSARLTQAGFSAVFNVPEGMLGSRAGPGWLAAKLPVYTP